MTGVINGAYLIRTNPYYPGWRRHNDVKGASASKVAALESGCYADLVALNKDG